MTTIGNLVTRFTVEGMDSVHNAVAQYGKDLDAAEKENQDFKKGLADLTIAARNAVIGITAAAAAIYALAANAGKFGAEIKDNARDLGLTTDEYQRWTHVATAAGSTADEMTDSLRQMSVRLKEAQTPGSEISATLKSLGISIYDTNGKMKSMNDLLFEILPALNSLPEGFDRNQASMALFGKSFSNIADLTSLTNQELKSLYDQPPAFSSDKIENLDSFNTQMNLLNEQLQILTVELGEELVPVVKDSFVPALEGAKPIIKDMIGLIDILSEALDRAGSGYAMYRDPLHWADIAAGFNERQASREWSREWGGQMGVKTATKPGWDPMGIFSKKGSSQTASATSTPLRKSLDEEITINLESIQNYLASIDTKKALNEDYAQDKKELDELVADTEVKINASKNQALKDMWKGLKTTIEDNPVQAFIDIQAALTMQKGGGDTGGLPGGESKGWNLGGSTWNGVGVGSQDSEMWIFMKSLYEAGYNYQDALNYWGTGETPPGVIIGTGGIKGKALGGPVMAGELCVVGEYGPELFSPDQNGTILPNLTTASEPLHVHVDIDGNEVGSALVDLIRVRTGVRF